MKSALTPAERAAIQAEQAAALVLERARFNADVAPLLVKKLNPAVLPEPLQASSRFAYFKSDEAFVIVSGIQEGSDAELALAYGLKLRQQLPLVLVLPHSCSLATLQRVPFLKPDIKPTVFLHDVAWGNVDPVEIKEAPRRTRKDAVDALVKRLTKGQSPADDLSDASTPKHLGADRSSAVAELVDWATAHPLLDSGHRKGERSWQCMGQKVLTIKGSSPKGIAIRAGIHYTGALQAPIPVKLAKGDALSAEALAGLQEQVETAINLRLSKGRKFHKPDEHWLQAVIRRDPALVGVEQPALRELPAWRPGGEVKPWGRGYIDLVGLDGTGDIRIVETKLVKNTDDLLIFQGLDYYVWALAYGSALRERLGAAKGAEIVVHYVLGATPPNDAVHISTYAYAQAAALEIPWRFQIVKSWFQPPQAPVGVASSQMLPPGVVP